MVFVERGIEAVGYVGEGMVVIADDDELAWPKEVLAKTQTFAAEKRFYVSKMMSRVHRYHLDDAPNLRSCNLVLASLPDNQRVTESSDIVDPQRLKNFYGRSKEPRAHYVREKKRLDYGQAPEDEYLIELLEVKGE